MACSDRPQGNKMRLPVSSRNYNEQVQPNAGQEGRNEVIGHCPMQPLVHGTPEYIRCNWAAHKIGAAWMAYKQGQDVQQAMRESPGGCSWNDWREVVRLALEQICASKDKQGNVHLLNFALKRMAVISDFTKSQANNDIASQESPFIEHFDGSMSSPLVNSGQPQGPLDTTSSPKNEPNIFVMRTIFAKINGVPPGTRHVITQPTPRMKTSKCSRTPRESKPAPEELSKQQSLIGMAGLRGTGRPTRPAGLLCGRGADIVHAPGAVHQAGQEALAEQPGEVDERECRSPPAAAAEDQSPYTGCASDQVDANLEPEAPSRTSATHAAAKHTAHLQAGCAPNGAASLLAAPPSIVLPTPLHIHESGLPAAWALFHRTSAALNISHTAPVRQPPANCARASAASSSLKLVATRRQPWGRQHNNRHLGSGPGSGSSTDNWRQQQDSSHAHSSLVVSGVGSLPQSQPASSSGGGDGGDGGMPHCHGGSSLASRRHDVVAPRQSGSPDAWEQGSVASQQPKADERQRGGGRGGGAAAQVHGHRASNMVDVWSSQRPFRAATHVAVQRNQQHNARGVPAHGSCSSVEWLGQQQGQGGQGQSVRGKLPMDSCVGREQQEVQQVHHAPPGATQNAPAPPSPWSQSPASSPPMPPSLTASDAPDNVPSTSSWSSCFWDADPPASASSKLCLTVAMRHSADGVQGNHAPPWLQTQLQQQAQSSLTLPPLLQLSAKQMHKWPRAPHYYPPLHRSRARRHGASAPSAHPALLPRASCPGHFLRVPEAAEQVQAPPSLRSKLHSLVAQRHKPVAALSQPQQP